MLEILCLYTLESKMMDEEWDVRVFASVKSFYRDGQDIRKGIKVQGLFSNYVEYIKYKVMYETLPVHQYAKLVRPDKKLSGLRATRRC